MEITGKIIAVLDPVSGVSKAGREWKKREYVMEVPSNNADFPARKVFFNFFGAAADQYVLTGGKDYKISFDIESREFNGRWFTDIRAWRAEEVQAGSGAPAPSMPAPPAYHNDDPLGAAPGNLDSFVSESSSSNDDLPF